jgi:hypothetical protein
MLDKTNALVKGFKLELRHLAADPSGPRGRTIKEHHGLLRIAPDK